ncbi:R-spondin-4 [Ornithorhynchus anatinus]|uniref:R-spondin-4 n=1 Tax=Ornithorhynchus anatinus TaxID=9258 RepID=UPI0019D4A1F6|nr:R-spondin-4 [Ornithorhynchus anatinus]
MPLPLAELLVMLLLRAAEAVGPARRKSHATLGPVLCTQEALNQEDGTHDGGGDGVRDVWAGSTEGNTVGSAGGGPRRSCPGCLSCSEENGCLSCRDKLFLYIGREGLRQVGLCLHDCPRGHFGLRAHDANRCKRCSSTCESCFSQDFCIRCSGGFFLHKGKCQPTCPPGTEPRPGDARECQENSVSRRRGKKERTQQKERKPEPSP